MVNLDNLNTIIKSLISRSFFITTHYRIADDETKSSLRVALMQNEELLTQAKRLHKYEMQKLKTLTDTKLQYKAARNKNLLNKLSMLGNKKAELERHLATLEKLTKEQNNG